MMKVAFVVPRDDGHSYPLNEFAQYRSLPPLGLARMAGHVGKHGTSCLVDERIGEARHADDADIAVVFINTYNRMRAYELAAHYHARGTYVVFTGPVLLNNPEQASDHADCLLIGEGASILPVFLSDFLRGKLRRLYAADQHDNPFHPAPFITADGLELRIA
jgi:radical SAM superfamily enzyme YgiQ (UPF0313 family)